MFQNIALTKPFAIIDLETTGIDPSRDRIVEISVLKIFPDGRQLQRTRRINPGMPIPAAATAIHGIRDEDVASEATFEELAKALLIFLDGCDLCGYNLKKFDLRMLCCAFNRAGHKFDLEGRAVIDPMEIFYHYEPRNLAAAVKLFLGRDHEGGHSAAADVLATAQVLDAMVARYDDLPHDVDSLHQQFTDPDQVDSDGFFKRVEGEIRFAKGKHKDKPLVVVATSNPDYLIWMLGENFFEDTKSVIRAALADAQPKRHAKIHA